MKPPARRQAPAQPKHRWGLCFGLGLLLTGALATGVAWWLRRPPTPSPIGLSDRGSTGLVAAVPSPRLAPLPPSGSPASDVLSEDAKDERAIELINQGTDRLAQGNAAGAVEAFMEALRHTPEDEDLHYNLGIAYARLGRLSDAEKHYREALRLFPDYPEVHNNLGNVLAQTNRLTEAVEQFQEAIRLMPEYAAAYNNLGTTLQKMGQVREAGLKFRKATELEPRYWEAYYNLANVYRSQNRLEDAAAALQNVLRLNPAFSPAQRALLEVRQKLAASQR